MANPVSMTLASGASGNSALTVTAKAGQTSGTDSTTVTAIRSCKRCIQRRNNYNQRLYHCSLCSQLRRAAVHEPIVRNNVPGRHGLCGRINRFYLSAYQQHF